MSNNESKGQETSLDNNKANDDNIIAPSLDKTDDNIPKTESETKMKCEDENLKELENVSAQVVSSSNVDNQAKVPDTKTLS